jgi:hypothetical protein
MRIILLLSLLLFHNSLSAQTLQGRLMDMQFSIEEPVTDQYYKLPNIVNVKIKALNNGPDTLCQGDTIFYGFILGAYIRRSLKYIIKTEIKPGQLLIITDTITFNDRPSPPFNQSFGKMRLELYGCAARNRGGGICGVINTSYDFNNNRGLNNTDTVWISYTNAQSGVLAGPFSRVKIYPNPFEKKIQLSFNEPIADVTISDISGRKVLDKPLYSAKTAELDLSSLKPGMYFLQLTDTDGNRHVETIIRRNE